MERKPSNAEQARPREEAAAKVAILAECDRLKEAGMYGQPLEQDAT